MAHPIFDRITYAWERQEAVDLFEVLTAVFWNSAEIVMLYEQSGGDRADLNIGQAPAHVWHDLLDQLAEEGRLRRFCTDVLPNVRRTQANEKFQAIVQAVIDAAPGAEATPEALGRTGSTTVLDGHLRRALSDALGSAFPKVADLRMLLDYGLDKRLEDITAVDSDYRAIRYRVIQAAEAEGWTGQLVACAREENPGNVSVRDVALRLGLA